MMKPNIGLSAKDCTEVVHVLNTLLSDEFILYTKTLNYHWNITGPHFHDLHKLLDTQYHELLETIDSVAERVRSLGGHALGSLLEFTQNTRLKEEPHKYPSAKIMISNLLSDHESIIANLRKDLETCQLKHHDAGTTDFLTGLMEHHEKTAWMLRALLE